MGDNYPAFAATGKTVYFTALNVYATTSFVFEATVIDNTFQRTTDTVQITIVDNFNSKNYTIESSSNQCINDKKNSYTLEEALELQRIRIEQNYPEN